MNTPTFINEKNLSEAWCQALDYIINNPGTELSPLVLTLTDFAELDAVRTIIDENLVLNDLDTIDTVASTIFPEPLYNFHGQNRQKLYEVYLKTLARLKKVDSRNNKGTYFERLIAFDEDKKINQLEIIIESLKGNSKVKRRSKLQASIFNPITDHTTGMFQGFPCLQHVTFYKSETGGLILNSFYAVQYLYQRSYGNWLGLINLGKFVAKESNLKFERFNCFIGVEKLDKLTKAKAEKLRDKINTVRYL